MILAPNFNFGYKINEKFKPTFNWKHTLHFNEESLKILSKKYNLKCVHFETVVSEIDNIKAICQKNGFMTDMVIQKTTSNLLRLNFYIKKLLVAEYCS